MILTEAEAATKRCPKSFGPVPAAPIATTNAVNPFGHGLSSGAGCMPSPYYCIGSACMAWRVAKEAVPAYPGVVAGRDGTTTYYQAGTERPEQPAKGSCGLIRV